MARASFSVTLGQSLGNGNYNTSFGSSPSASIDVAEAIADLALLTTAITGAKAAVDAAETSGDSALAAASTANTAAGISLTVVTTADTNADLANGTLRTNTVSAIAAVDATVTTLNNDGPAPTEAHVDDLVAAWATFNTAWGLLNTAIGTAATSTETAKTAATTLDTALTSLIVGVTALDALLDTAKTATDALSTTTVAGDLTAIDAADAGDVVLDINTSVVTNQNAARAALRALTQALAGSGMATG